MPRKRIDRRHALLIGVAGLALLAGCTASSGGTLADAERVSDEVQTRYDALDGYSATVTQTVTTRTGTSTVQARVTANTSSWARIEYLNGPRAGTVRTVDLSADGTAPTFSAGLQPATDGRVHSYGALAETLVRTNNVTVEGTETLDGHRTVVVSFVPEQKSAAGVSVERRVWVDVDRRVPLRVETTWTGADGQTATETVRYTDVNLYENGSVPQPSAPDDEAQTGVSAT